MTKSKALENIRPFNDFFYRDCFYNAFFPMLQHFGANPLTFLVNDVVVYNVKPSSASVVFDVEYGGQLTAEQLLADANIAEKAVVHSRNVVNDLIAALSKNHLTILRTDCFYEPIRPDLYRKEHWSHALLVFGYDERKQLFHVLEHDHRDRLNYEKKTLSFADLHKSYYGFLEHFLKDNQYPTLMEYSFSSAAKQPVVTPQMNRQLYLQNMQENEGRIRQGIDELVRYASHFQNLALHEETLRSHAGDIIGGINNIVNAKLAEKHKVAQLFGEEHLLDEPLEQVFQAWSLIRTALLKFVYTNVYKSKSFAGLEEQVLQIAHLERTYFENLQRFHAEG